MAYGIVWISLARPVQADDAMMMLQNAKTAADHEALAAYYDKEAADAKEKAALHKSMGDVVKKQGGPGVAKWHMDQHCDELVKKYEDAAKAYMELAKAEREIAKGMK